MQAMASLRRLTLTFLGIALVSSGNSQPAERDRLPLPMDSWRLVSDGVMGGVSTGSMRSEEHEGRVSVCLTGNVSTANNGGFIQLAMDIDAGFAARAADYDGVSLQVRGNGESYNVHLRSSDLWLPWQSYRAEFVAGAKWHSVRLPFARFLPYKTGSTLHPKKLRRIGVVAIGRDFKADICVADLAFYRER